MRIDNALTIRILLFMLIGMFFGMLLNALVVYGIDVDDINKVLVVAGDVFLSLLEMLVIPVVFVSLVSTICGIGRFYAVSHVRLKVFKWFVITTLCASLIAIFIAGFFRVGSILYLDLASTYSFANDFNLSFWQIIDYMIPHNPIQALAEGNMLQIVVFAVLFGIVINVAGGHGKRIATFFHDLNIIGIRTVALFMRLVPYGVFCLVAVLFAQKGVALILGMLEYFVAVIFVLFLHTILTYSTILSMFRFSPKIFFQKIYSVMLFAFNTSSSSAAMPMMLDTVEHKLGVNRSIASLVVPLGININKNGTAIMQIVATIFIANIYHVQIGLAGYAILTMMVMFMSIGTVGAPGLGLITLIMVLRQLGLPIEGIALVIGVERLLDMVRSSVNVAGNAMVSCLVGKSLRQLDQNVYHKP